MEKSFCDFCERGVPLVTPKDTNDRGIAIAHMGQKRSYMWLYAYGYDVHGTGSNGLGCEIYFCPICGKSFRDEE